MATPPPKKLIAVDDIKDAPAWLEGVVSPINAVIKATAAALDRGVTFREQFAGEVKTVTLTPPDDWLPVTFGAGWAQRADALYPPCSYRGHPDGTWEARGLAVRNSGTGTQIVALPSEHAPAAGFQRIMPTVANAAAASALITTTGIEYLSGATTPWFSLDGLWWETRTRLPERWDSPVDVKLGSPSRPFAGKPGAVILLNVRPTRSVTSPAIVTGMDWSVFTQDKSNPAVRIHRVWGLTPGVQYELTLLILPE